jgi:chorismate mutase
VPAAARALRGATTADAGPPDRVGERVLGLLAEMPATADDHHVHLEGAADLRDDLPA